MSPVKKKKKKGVKKSVKRGSKKSIKKVTLKKKVQAKKKAVVKKAKAPKDLIGEVTHYFGHVSAMAVKLKQDLAVGEAVRVKGHTTDFTQTVTSMQLEHQPISVGKKGQEIGLQVNERVRTGDQVFRVAREASS